jgi:uncharacterized protein with HEPN domain
MLDAAREAQSFARGKKRESLDTDRKLSLALVRSIEIVGEAAARLSDACRRSLPQIPCQNIIGMRNRPIHAYYDINLEIVWRTLVENLPCLIDELEKVVRSDYRS